MWHGGPKQRSSRATLAHRPWRQKLRPKWQYTFYFWNFQCEHTTCTIYSTKHYRIVSMRFGTHHLEQSSNMVWRCNLLTESSGFLLRVLHSGERGGSCDGKWLVPPGSGATELSAIKPVQHSGCISVWIWSRYYLCSLYTYNTGWRGLTGQNLGFKPKGFRFKPWRSFAVANGIWLVLSMLLLGFWGILWGLKHFWLYKRTKVVYSTQK